MTVFANGREISAKAQGCKVIAAFPDVCFTPPQTPATPPGVPIPYPNFGLDTDLTSGSSTVKIGGKTISLENKSHYSKCSGDEAGCAPKKGIITSKNTGKVYAQAWSMDVKVEGKGVARLGDIATTNHGSNTGDDPPMVIVGAPAVGVIQVPVTTCPCCGTSPAHANQLDANGQMLQPITEAAYYQRGQNARRPTFVADVQNMQDAIQRLQPQLDAMRARNPAIAARIEGNMALSQNALRDRQAALQQFDDNYARLQNARNEQPPCPNLHNPPDQDCGIHFDRTGAPPMPEPRDLGYTEQFGQDFKREWDRVHGTNTAGMGGGHQNRNNHMTPLNAGGCPTGTGNIIPHQALSPACQQLDDIQSDLQG
jgi:uncharacterized Zn-binding protein involved in type VI secretion